MKPTRRIVSLLLLMAMIVGIFAVPSIADGHIHMCDGVDNLTAPMCPQCAAYITDECQGGAAKTEVGTHKYGFLWQDTCEVVYGYCYSRRICYRCGYVEYENRGPHLCFEYHRNCGDGHVSLCPIGWYPDVD